MKEKIALVLARTLGDVLLIHNLVDGIYKKYKNPEIDIYTNSVYEDLITGNSKVHRIFPSPNWLENWGYILGLISGNLYTDVLIPQQLTHADTVWHQLEHLRHQHLIDYYLDRCRLPKRNSNEILQLYITQHDIDAVKRILEVNKPGKYVVVHTTSGVPTKDWNKFSSLVYELLMELNVSVFQVGLKSDEDAYPSQKELPPMGSKFFDVREQLTFSQVGALCREAECFVGLDSGLSYVAAATGKPTVVLQGSTVPETSSPWGSNVIHILAKTLSQCQNLRCHTHCRYPQKVPMGKCINNIGVVQVKEVIAKILSNEKVTLTKDVGDEKVLPKNKKNKT